MKHRLAVPLTEEDMQIWLSIGGNKWSDIGRSMIQQRIYMRADRRAADIMRIGVMNPWCMITWEDQPGTEHVLLRWKPNREEGRTLFPFIGYGQ